MDWVDGLWIEVFSVYGWSGGIRDVVWQRRLLGLGWLIFRVVGGGEAVMDGYGCSSFIRPLWTADFLG